MKVSVCGRLAEAKLGIGDRIGLGEEAVPPPRLGAGLLGAGAELTGAGEVGWTAGGVVGVGAGVGAGTGTGDGAGAEEGAGGALIWAKLISATAPPPFS